MTSTGHTQSIVEGGKLSPNNQVTGRQKRLIKNFNQKLGKNVVCQHPVNLVKTTTVASSTSIRALSLNKHPNNPLQCGCNIIEL